MESHVLFLSCLQLVQGLNVGLVIIKPGKRADWSHVSFLSIQSVSTIAVHGHAAEEWPEVRGGRGGEAGAENSRESPDGGEDPAGGAAQGHDGKSVTV